MSTQWVKFPLLWPQLIEQGVLELELEEVVNNDLLGAFSSEVMQYEKSKLYFW